MQMLKAAQIFNQRGIAPIVLLLVFLVVAVAGGSYYQFVYKPKLVKESTNKIQTDYKALSRSADELIQRYSDEVSVTDSTGTMKDYVEDLKKLSGDVDKDLKNLEKSLSKKQSEVKGYTANVDEYYKAAKDYFNFVNGGITLMDKVAQSSEDLTEVGAALMNSGDDVSLAKKRINEGITKLKQSIKDVEDAQTGEEYKDMKEAVLEILKLSQTLLEEAKGALDSNDVASLNAAIVGYNQDVAVTGQKLNDASDALRDKQKEFKDKLEAASDKADTEYNKLDQKYK